MKHNLRLGDTYGLKRTQPKQRIPIRNLRAVRNTLMGCIAFMQTFFSLCSAAIHAVCVLDVCRMREILTYSLHTAYIGLRRWCNKRTSKTKEIRRDVWPHRANREESCVCTPATAPARNGLGLALWLVVE